MCGFSCFKASGILVSQTETEPGSQVPCIARWILNHWITREDPFLLELTQVVQVPTTVLVDAKWLSLMTQSVKN